MHTNDALKFQLTQRIKMKMKWKSRRRKKIVMAEMDPGWKECEEISI